MPCTRERFPAIPPTVIAKGIGRLLIPSAQLLNNAPVSLCHRPHQRGVLLGVFTGAISGLSSSSSTGRLRAASIMAISSGVSGVPRLRKYRTIWTAVWRVTFSHPQPANFLTYRQ
jgi:hypothetical protein